MGGSSSKRTFIWQKKKKSPLNKAWSQLKGAVPNKKRKKKVKLPLNLDNLKRDRKRGRRKSSSSSAGKGEASPLKRLSLSNPMKEWTQSSPPGRRKKKDGGGGGGLGNIGDHIKKKLSLSM